MPTRRCWRPGAATTRREYVRRKAVFRLLRVAQRNTDSAPTDLSPRPQVGTLVACAGRRGYRDVDGVVAVQVASGMCPDGFSRAPIRLASAERPAEPLPLCIPPTAKRAPRCADMPAAAAIAFISQGGLKERHRIGDGGGLRRTRAECHDADDRGVAQALTRRPPSGKRNAIVEPRPTHQSERIGDRDAAGIAPCVPPARVGRASRVWRPGGRGSGARLRVTVARSFAARASASTTRRRASWPPR